jgi:uncharacterized protein (TIGR02145 family)/uncharacterized repeat protein (TIGR02543 family)
MSTAGRFKTLAAAVAVMVLAIGAWAGDYTLEVSVNPADGGTVSIDPKMDSYIEWVDVKVTATPSSGYAFDGWSGESTAKTNNITIEMSGGKNKKLTANFKVASGTFKDSRDGKTYKKIEIGNQTWMAENLNFAGIKSACYENKEENCAKDGRLYNWEMATKGCPAGFHLPSTNEWRVLRNYVGEYGGAKLKSTSEDNYNGTDDYGFSALPGGRGYSDGSFENAGKKGYWWSASERDAESAIRQGVDYGDWDFSGKTQLLSVRCVEDVIKRGSFTDKRDGKVYKTVKIGSSQTWIAENLNFAAKGSVCYGNSTTNCAKYGRLYDWSTAMKACPAGTHLSTDAEWTTLTDYVGGEEIAGEILKSTSGWNNYSQVTPFGFEKRSGNGTDDYGFSALPGGFGDSKGKFGHVGDAGIWWSATADGTGNVWFQLMGNEVGKVVRDGGPKTNLCSVRCVADK